MKHTVLCSFVCVDCFAFNLFVVIFGCRICVGDNPTDIARVGMFDRYSQSKGSNWFYVQTSKKRSSRLYAFAGSG